MGDWVEVAVLLRDPSTNAYITRWRLAEVVAVRAEHVRVAYAATYDEHRPPVPPPPATAHNNSISSSGNGELRGGGGGGGGFSSYIPSCMGGGRQGESSAMAVASSPSTGPPHSLEVRESDVVTAFCVF